MTRLWKVVNGMMELESMAVEMPVVEGHPNRAGFRGVLTVVDVASQRAPAGSKGHRVVLTKSAAEAALPSLLGMALDYAPTYDRHDQRRKVGVITSAEIVGKDLVVGGYLYAKDFPEVVKEIGKSGRNPEFEDRTSKSPFMPKAGLNGAPALLEATRHAWRSPASGLEARNPEAITKGLEFPRLANAARRGASPHMGVRRELAAAVERLRELTAGMMGRRVSNLRAGNSSAGAAQGLGMSFEVADAVLADRRAHVWILTRVTFTGAAILRRDRAAYEDTWIALES